MADSMTVTHSLRRVLRFPQTPETRAEALVFSTLIVVFLVFLGGALNYAAREHRDGVRRQQLREIKTELERWYNSTNGFPLHPSGDLGWCGSTDDPEDWFFTSFLKRERQWSALVRDPKASRSLKYRYCPTVLEAKKGEGTPLAAGFFLEATLENRRPGSAGFNAEHNVFERTFTPNGRTRYWLCGGRETQCGTEQP
ncbi:MAG: hypothetical protein G01um101438_583 [Parcubacteria group bacterium Gr01-1014_38]|nr:MAG: hypothetical protein G01um101438_583 [Parcubacteria group bacterium Gr01-1014_38]